MFLACSDMLCITVLIVITTGLHPILAVQNATRYESVSCTSDLLQHMYQFPTYRGTATSFTTTVGSDPTLCSEIAIASNRKYFALSMGACYIQITGIYNYHSDAPLLCSFGGSTTNTYENLLYEMPTSRQVVSVPVESKDFVVLNETSFNYILAIEMCNSMNKDLAELNSAQEINKLKQEVQREISNLTRMNFWIYMDRASGRKMFWRISETPVPVSGPNQDWKTGYPSNNSEQECGVMSGQDNLQWITESCSTFNVFPICQNKPKLPQAENAECHNGYHLSAWGSCIDIDECNTKPCGIGWCYNTKGSYYCDCLSGSTLNATSNICEDIDECLNASSCLGGKCSNLVRSYECDCPKGFYFNASSRNCDDLNECETNQALCHSFADCTNRMGGYNCECKKYFVGDGFLNCTLSTKAAQSFHITCLPNVMEITVDAWVIKAYGPMTLRNTSCQGVGKLNSANPTWNYMIVNDLSSCGNSIFDNGTHIIYVNVLTNNQSVISYNHVSGVTFQAKWSCVFKTKNLKSSLSTHIERNGTGFIDFQLGKPNKEGLYPKSVSGIVKTHYGNTIVGGSLVDSSLYGGKKPVGVTNEGRPAVKEGPQIPGDPYMSVTLANGSVFHPDMSEETKKILLQYKQHPGNGINVKNEIANDFEGLNGTGAYPIKILPFTDDTFLQLQRKTMFTTKDILFLRVALLTTDIRLAIVAQRCWGTPEPNPLSQPSVQLIVNGCSVPQILQNSVKIFRNGVVRTADFQTQVFKFNDANSTYIHCKVDICDLTKENCKPICDQGLQRKRRSVDHFQPSGRMNRTVHFGPYFVEQDHHNTNLFQSVDQVSVALAVILALLCVIGLALLCCIFCARRKHRRRKQKRVLI